MLLSPFLLYTGNHYIFLYICKSFYYFLWERKEFGTRAFGVRRRTKVEEEGTCPALNFQPWLESMWAEKQRQKLSSCVHKRLWDLQCRLSCCGAQMLRVRPELGYGPCSCTDAQLAPPSAGPGDLGHGKEAALHGHLPSPNRHDCGSCREGSSQGLETGEQQGRVWTSERGGQIWQMSQID